ncbi:hypothetical protein BJV78DRAFT_1283105 [Lactifluus subvellereus]|nr:hypothetical protein BJV78DRAFT_1283105 [Lactifluus subvellereus]
MALQPKLSPAPAGPVSRASASSRPAPAGKVVRNPPDITVTYSYGSRMVLVTPGDSYKHAIDRAQKVFPELKDVDRGQIYLTVRHRSHTDRGTV